MFGEKWPIKRQEKNRKFGGRVRKINSSMYRFLFYTPFCMELSNTMRYWKMDSFLFVFYSLGPWCLSMVCPTYNGLSLNNERILMHELRRDLLGNVQISCENGIKTRPSSSRSLELFRIEARMMNLCHQFLLFPTETTSNPKMLTHICSGSKLTSFENTKNL